jgi:hypothetical protein
MVAEVHLSTRTGTFPTQGLEFRVVMIDLCRDDQWSWQATDATIQLMAVLES